MKIIIRKEKQIAASNGAVTNIISATSALILSAVIAVCTFLITRSIETAKTKSEYLGLAIKILSSDTINNSDEKTRAMRSWAVRMIVENSPVSVTQAENKSMTDGGLHSIINSKIPADLVMSEKFTKNKVSVFDLAMLRTDENSLKFGTHTASKPDKRHAKLAANSDAKSSTAGIDNLIHNFSKDELSALPYVLSAVSYVGGSVLLKAGTMSLKKHAEEPSSEKMNAGISRLLTGGAITAVPTLRTNNNSEDREGKDGSKYSNFSTSF